MLVRVFISILLVVGSKALASAQILGTDLFASNIGNDSTTLQANVYYFCNSYFTVNDTLTVDVLVSGVDTVRVVAKPKISIIDTVYNNCHFCGCPDTFCSFPYIIRKKLIYEFIPNSYGFQNVCEMSAQISPGKRYSGNVYAAGADTTLMTVRCNLSLCQSIRPHKFNFSIHPSFYALNGKSYLNAQGFNQVFDTFTYKTEIDSIHAQLAQPIRRFGSPLNFNKGYDYLNPLQYNGYPNTTNSFPRGFHLVAETGDIRFTPTQKGDAIIKTEFKTYSRNGLIQVAQREFILTVLNRKNENIPYLTGKGASSFLNADNYKLYTCWGQKNRSFFLVKDLDNLGIGQIEVEIQQAFENQIDYKLSGDSIFFEFGFDSFDLSTRPIKINFKLLDTICNTGSESSFSILLYNNFTPITTPVISFKGKRTIGLSGTIDSAERASHYLWRINGLQFNKLDTVFELKTPGNYKYKLISFGKNGCNDTVSSTYKTPLFPYVLINSIGQALCQYDSVTLNSSYFYSTQPPEYSWNGQKLGSALDVVIISDTTIILSVIFNDGTVNSDTIDLSVLPNPIPNIIAPDYHCSGNNLELLAEVDSNLLDTANALVWQIDTGLVINKSNIEISKEERVTLFVSYINGCVNNNTKFFDYNIDYNNGLDGLESCPQEQLIFEAKSASNFNHTLYISDSVFTKSSNTFTYPRVKQSDTLILETRFDSFNAKCIFIDTISINILPVKRFNIQGDSIFCANDDPLWIRDTIFINPKNGTWTIPAGKKNAFRTDSFFPSILAPLDTQYLATYTVNNPDNGCKFSREISFSIKPVFAPQFVADSIRLCIGGENILLNNIDYAIPSTGKWSGKGIIDSLEKQYFSPSLVGINSTNTLNYYYEGNNGCISKSDVIVTVNLKPNPVARVRSGIAPISISFSDLRETTDCQVDEWFWDFYDNYADPCTLDVVVDTVGELFCRYSTAPNPVHRYRKSGIYPVKLVVRDSKTGVKDSITKYNYIFLIGNSIDNYDYSQISIYPNPTSEGKMIIEQDDFDVLYYEVLSSTGQLLKRGISNGSRGFIDYESFKGLLLISVFNKEKTFTYTQRVLVK